MRCITIMQFAVYEEGRFIGTIVFATAPRRFPEMFGCGPKETCELTRVALGQHETQVSRIVAVAIRFLRRQRPALRLIVSYADTAQGHHGGIYQGGGWIYTGTGATTSSEYVLNGRKVHARTISSRYGTFGRGRLKWLREHVDPEARVERASLKHRYVMPLDDEMRARALAMAEPYPKRAKQAMAGPTGTAAV